MSWRIQDRGPLARTPGIRHVAFAVDDIDAVVASLRARGVELVAEVERDEDSYRLCYVRGRSCRLSGFQDLLERVEVGCHRRLDPGGGEGSQ